MNPYNIAVHIRYSVHRKCPAGTWRIEPRMISDHELVLITNGSGDILIEGKAYSAKPGILFYFYPGLLHSLESSPDNPMDFYAFHFSYALVDYQNDQWTIETCDTPIFAKSAMEIVAYKKLEGVFKELNSHWTIKSPGYELMCNSLMIQAYHHVLQETINSGVNYSARLKVDQAIGFIKQNMDKKLSINQVAQAVSLSPDYLSHLFKVFTGYPLNKYINKCRVDAAKEQLEGGHKKIKEVAAQFGFKDEFYFSRVFKQFEGISPRQFCRN